MEPVLHQERAYHHIPVRQSSGSRLVVGQAQTTRNKSNKNKNIIQHECR